MFLIICDEPIYLCGAVYICLDVEYRYNRNYKAVSIIFKLINK